MKPNAVRLWLVEEVGVDGFLNISSKLLPCIALREDVMRKALCYKALVLFLHNAKNDFHTPILALSLSGGKHAFLALPDTSGLNPLQVLYSKLVFNVAGIHR